MPRTKVARNLGNNKRARENANELEEIIRDFEIEGKQIKLLAEFEKNYNFPLILADNSIQLLKSELAKAIREIDAEFENIKRSIPPHVLCMKMKDVRKLKDLNEKLIEEKIIEEKMTNLNVTVKETVNKADDGEFCS